MKKFLITAGVGMALAFSGSALAHGGKPKHGGIVQTAGDLSFELVAKDGKTTIHVEDHGKDKPTAGASGVLTVLKGTDKFQVPLAAGGANTLVAQGDARLARGAKAVAAITFANGQAVSVRFAVK